MRLGVVWVLFPWVLAAQVQFAGRVVDENDAPVANARVSAGDRETYTGATGTFQLALRGAGPYTVTVDRQGYFQFKKSLEAGTDVTLVLNEQREVFQSIEVGAQPSQVEPEQTQGVERLSGTEVNDIPYPSSHSLRNAMRLMPGVIQDPTGGLHFHGGAEYQTRYTLNGFDITDPITNRFTTRLAVEGVRQMEWTPTGESAGTLAIQTNNGTDQLQYTATNFIPGVDTKAGLHFGDWTPRAGISGPIVKGRAWFSDSFDGEYSSGVLTGLPSGQDTNAFWAAGNLLHTQVNLNATNILYADLLTNFDHQSHFGLGVLDPQQTTTALNNREWMAGVKENHSWTGGAVLETGFEWLQVGHTRTPMGDALYVIAPDGRSGNYYVRSEETGRRAQVFTNLFPAPLHWKGRHQLQVGGSGERLNYRGDFARTGFEQIGLAGLPLSATTFVGSGVFELPDTTAAVYANDHWQPRGNLYVDAGVRADRDELVRGWAVSPRVAASWAPFGDARTKVMGGFAVLHDAADLGLFAKALDQEPVTVQYTNGVAGTPLVNTFGVGRNLRLPRYDQWSAGAQHEFGHRVTANLEWQRKRGSTGFVYAPSGTANVVDVNALALSYGLGGNYVLSNLRVDRYDEASITVRQRLGQQYEWMASYTRSSAISNTVLDINADQPLQVANNFGAMPWDAPNRAMGWAYLPLPWHDWAVAALVDYRTGFPYPVVDQTGAVQGAVDSHRYPSTFDLNLHIERRFVYRGYRLALRVGANNLTAHRNPTAVNNVAGAAAFGTFYGDEGRHFVVRVRFLGRLGR
jgi:Carboxypeptidase regulatory-like domain